MGELSSQYIRKSATTHAFASPLPPHYTREPHTLLTLRQHPAFARGMPAGARPAPAITTAPTTSPPSSWAAFLTSLNVSSARSTLPPVAPRSPSAILCSFSQAACLSLPLVRFLRALFLPRCNNTMLLNAPDSLASSECAPSAPPRDAPMHRKPSLNFTQLPDEIVSMCYAPLPATDLVSLELVSRRMHSLVSADSVCWRKRASERWGNHANSALLNAAARHAGSWKALYSQKFPCELRHAPWLVPCDAETAAMLDLIKGAPTCPSPLVRAAPKTGAPASSPRAVSGLRMEGAPRLSVVLLIDGSSSVTEEDFSAMKKFADALLASLGETHPTAALALVQFNQNPKVEAPLTPVSRGSLRHAISTLDQMMGSTDIAAPIRRAREMLEDEPVSSPKAIVLLTDGQTHADELQDSEREARAANKAVGARIFTLGVGRDVDVSGLTRVATGCATSPADAAPSDLTQGCYFTLRCLANQ